MPEAGHCFRSCFHLVSNVGRVRLLAHTALHEPSSFSKIFAFQLPKYLGFTQPYFLLHLNHHRSPLTHLVDPTRLVPVNVPISAGAIKNTCLHWAYHNTEKEGWCSSPLESREPMLLTVHTPFSPSVPQVFTRAPINTQSALLSTPVTSSF